MNVFLYISVIIFTGMLFGRLAKFIRLPNVTGYLVGGLIIGPAVLNIIPAEALKGFDLISEIALGFIAFSIGSEFRISYFKRVGATPIVIAIFESFFAVLFVAAGLIVAGNGVPFSLALASIVAATAPAATVMVIRQYKAKGKVTEALLSVVAIDDATALIFFGIASSIARGMMGSSSVSFLSAFVIPFGEILGAIAIGFVIGLIFIIPLRWFKKDGNRLALTIAFVLLGTGVAKLTGFSSLLLSMAMGAALCNMSSQSTHIMRLADSLTPPIFIMFFVVSGAELQLSVLPSIGVVGIIYVVFRVIGKMSGTFVGGRLCNADKSIRKYLGPCLIPQAGVAIGLSLVVTGILPEFGARIRAVILCGTLIYELVGPGITKLCLSKAGEIK